MTKKAPESAPSILARYSDTAMGAALTTAKFDAGYAWCLADRCLSPSCLEICRQALLQGAQLHFLVVIINRLVGFTTDIGLWLDKLTSWCLQELRIISATILRRLGKAMPNALRN